MTPSTCPNCLGQIVAKLREVASVRKAIRHPPLKQRHRDEGLEWVKKYMKTDFSSVTFTDKCRATLDEPDGWAGGWIFWKDSAPVRVRRQQGGVGVMFWAAIVGDGIIGPFRVADGVKLDSEAIVPF